MRYLHIETALTCNFFIRAVKRYYLLNTSFKAFAGRNFTFWEAAIWICSHVLGFLPTLAFLSIMAYISISLGFINLLPIPLLDGGHLMFYAFEKVLGRPLTQRTQEGFFRIGLFLLLSLMFFTTFNDLKDLGLF